jgi:hypothetical protein
LTNNLTTAGFVTVVDDTVVYKERLARLLAFIEARPVYMAVLAPDLERVRDRDKTRPEKSVFHIWAHLDEVMRREIAGIGCWVDSTRQSPEETTNEVMERVWTEGLIAGS